MFWWWHFPRWRFNDYGTMAFTLRKHCKYGGEIGIDALYDAF